MGEVVFNDEFFAPVSTDAISMLVAECDGHRKRIDTLAAYMESGDAALALHYFLDGYNRDGHRLDVSVQKLFQPEGAYGALNAAYWSKALQLTDVLDVMPQARRSEWHEQIRNPLGIKQSNYSKEWKTPPLPEFNEDNARSTLIGMLNMRAQFMAERVDGIFRGLSGEHVTNAPEAFGKRMIVGYVLDGWHSVNYQKAGLINDLRCVIAKFMGRDEPKHDATTPIIYKLKECWGEWVSIDGGALRIRLYKKGTAHLEVHPDLAWRLNGILAHLYPLAIPAQFRQKPARKVKEFDLMQRPLPFAVTAILSRFEPAKKLDERQRWSRIDGAYQFPFATDFGDKHAFAEACRVIDAIGGVRDGNLWRFDYEPSGVVNLIVASGCIPDSRSHQFYPTPERLARMAVELADIGCNDACLEPSAGTGGIADCMPKDRTTCVEVSTLHCKVLAAKGHRVERDDFLKWQSGSFDRIVMNPPFDQGRWQAHVEHAASMLADGGRLVSILPSGAQTRKNLLPGLTKEWRGPFDGEFAGTSVSVVILVANR